MKTNYIIASSLKGLFIFLGLAVVAACGKTKYDYLQKPYTNIEQFKIAGYGTVDSISAVVKGDEVIIYWSGEAIPPARIKPVITISEGAKITPQSGEEVPFSEQTTYTVTAEDGTTRQLKLKPVFNKAIPVMVTVPVAYRWAQSAPLNIVGEYFFTTGNWDDVKVYAQRIRDGYEFDLAIDRSLSSSAQLSVRLPDMTSEQDTGAHRIYVKVGDFESNYLQTNLRQFSLTNDPLIQPSSVIVPPAQPLKPGDSLTLRLDLKGIVPEHFGRFYGQSGVTGLLIRMEKPGGSQTIIRLNNTGYTVKDNLIKVLVGNGIENHIGSFVHSIDVTRLGNGVESGNTYTHHLLGSERVRIHNANGLIPDDNFEADGAITLQFAQAGQSISINQDLLLNCSFNNEAVRSLYAGKNTRVELLFRNITTNGRGRYTSVIATSRIDNGGNISFRLPASANVTVADNFLYGFRLIHASAGSPAKYLYSSLLFADTNTPYVKN